CHVVARVHVSCPSFPTRRSSDLVPNSYPSPHRLEEIGMAPVLQGLGTALILAIVEQVRNRDEQTQAVASAEARALQARMNPHFRSEAPTSELQPLTNLPSPLLLP